MLSPFSTPFSFYDWAASNTSLAVTVTDIRRRITWVNEGFTHLTGYSLEEAVDQLPEQLLQFEKTDSLVVAAMREALDEGRPFHGTLLNRSKQGHEYHVETDIHPLHDATGTLIGFVSTQMDVTQRVEAQQLAWAKSEELERYFESSLDLLCIISADSLFKRVNPLWHSVMGYFPEDMIGRPFLDFVHPDDVVDTLSAVSGMTESQGILIFENRYRAADGTFRSLEWRARTLGADLYASARDVTELRRQTAKMAEQARILEFILEDVLAGYSDWQVLENRQFYSPKMLEVMGRGDDPPPTTPEAWRSWLLPEDLPAFLACFEAHEASHGAVPFHCEVRFRRKDGSIIWLLCAGQIIEWTDDGRAKRMIGVHLDISSSKQAEEDLREAMTQAEALRQQAESAHHAKSTFLATMSHEIRTPMNAVIGMAALLRSTPLNAEQEEFVQTIYQSGDALLSLINDILDFSKIEAGQLTLEEVVFDLADSVIETLDLLFARASEKKVELTYFIESNCPAALQGDVARLRQILINLVGNAIKFTEEGAISVKVEAEAVAGGRWRIHFAVKDSGIGMDAEALSKLFQPFTQADSSVTRRFGGTGLGLSICKRLVEAMGGAIYAESTPGEGSTFHFYVEMPGAARSGEARPPDRARELLSERTVLVVDDNEINRKLFHQQLELWGMQVIARESALEALATLRQRSADLIITDYQMPQMDGAEFVRRARSLLGEKCPPVLAATSSDLVGNIEKGLFDAVMTKPVKPRLLRERLLHLLTKNEAGATLPKVSSTPALFDESLAEKYPLRILVCEDNIVNQRVIGHMLKKLGYSPLFASDGFEGLEECRRQPIDLILMDVQMPRMGGLELTRKVRAELGTPAQGGPYIVALTAAAMLEDRMECLEAGMDHYLSKPVPTGKLQETIHLAWASCHAATTAGPVAPVARLSAAELSMDSLDLEQIDLLISFGETPGEGQAVLAILRDFRETLPSLWESLEAALSHGDHESRKKMLHKLKGAGRSIGLKALGEAAEHFEGLAEDEKPVPATALRELQEIVEVSWKNLDAYLESKGVGSILP